MLDGISRLGVIGAGQMGRGIAQLAASHGYAVTLADSGRDVAARGVDRDRPSSWTELVEKGKVTAPADRAAIVGRISPADLYGSDPGGRRLRRRGGDRRRRRKRQIFETLDRGYAAAGSCWRRTRRPSASR